MKTGWKTPAQRRLAGAVARLALRRSGREFSANDLPAELEHGGRGVCGTVFRVLAMRGVLRAAVHELASGQVPKVTLNHGGNRIGVYELANAARARQLI